MTHADINDLETRDYIFKIGDRGKGIKARYDKNTEALIFPRGPFDYVFELLNEALSQEQKSGKWEFHCQHWSKCSICGYADKFADKWNYCPNCGAKMENVEKSLIDIKAESSGC